MQRDRVRTVIGYYIHHQGRGHLHRAMAIADALPVPVTGLSSLERPAGWVGPWVLLPRDDAGGAAIDVTAGDRLHWVPVHDDGLRDRMSLVSQWIAAAAPDLLVSDVSVEVALLARLHGVPVVTFAMAGDRSDDAHTLAYDISSLILACWPQGMQLPARGLSAGSLAKVRAVGAIARFPVNTSPGSTTGSNRVVVLAGRGGSTVTPRLVEAAARQTPEWRWTVLGGQGGEWVDEPWPVILSADVVVTHAGESAMAEVAAARKPAVVIAEHRPHGEQLATAEVLRESARWPAVVADRFPTHGWGELLDSVARLDGDGWREWNDGLSAHRAAGLIMGAIASQARLTR
ncbi:MAG: hypothetical protein JWO10_558 [Microbacteriaceae bacterium]|nr:hypothetical protein [Microbacteriaceae bacterium]